MYIICSDVDEIEFPIIEAKVFYHDFVNTHGMKKMTLHNIIEAFRHQQSTKR